LENATNVAAKGATPLAAVDCLNGGNPEKPDVYGGFKGIVDGLAEMCQDVGVPVVGGNVSLYNDSVAGPIPPTPTLAMAGTKDGYEAPPAHVSGEGSLVLVGDLGLDADDPRLGGSELLAQFGGSDAFPALPENPAALVETLATVADDDATHAVHDVSHGGLAVALAEMTAENAGLSVSLESDDAIGALFHEQPGRVVIETSDPDAVIDAFGGVAPAVEIGAATDDGQLDLEVGDKQLLTDAETVAALRSVIEDTLD
jgi:phosphoribosylformylglycinamidine synthase